MYIRLCRDASLYIVGSGLYLKALSCGIDRVLGDYRQALIELEQKVSV